MAWENSNDIFWGNDRKFFKDNQYLTSEQLQINNPSQLEAILIKPIRDVVEYEEHIIYYPNGNMQIYYTYSVFPNNLVDGIPLLNAYGQFIHNNLSKEKESEFKECQI